MEIYVLRCPEAQYIYLYQDSSLLQSYEIKSPPWTILWFRILGIFSVEYIKRLRAFMFKSCSNSLLCTDSQYSSQQLTIGATFKHKCTQPLYIFNRENPQNSETQNGLRRGLDFIALQFRNPFLLKLSLKSNSGFRIFKSLSLPLHPTHVRSGQSEQSVI